MFVDTLNPLNQGILRYLGRGGKSHNPLIAAPDSVRDPYMHQGSHPDIVQRVWDELGANLPLACRCLIFGTPSLAHDLTGTIIAISNGTQYNLRLTPSDLQGAIAKGASTRTRWSSGEIMDSVEELGSDWIFGGWFKEESKWCRDTYDQVGGVKQAP
jgi:hypothetical protein